MDILSAEGYVRAVLKIKLSRDLRKNILRGHPWVYHESIDNGPTHGQASLCQVLDKKKKPLAWAIYSPQSTLALRILSTEAKPPGAKFFAQKMQRAFELRTRLFDQETTCYRLFNGEGDGLPGMVCDIYGKLAVLQFDGVSCFEFWDQDFVANWLLEHAGVSSVYFKPRFSDDLQPKWWGETLNSETVGVKENGLSFLVDYQTGQKTGFFLDQRENRQSIGKMAKGLSVLNLFSYTGGFSLYAGNAGAESVTSVDIAPEAIKMAQTQWELNKLSVPHQGVCQDVFEFLKETQETWDLIIVDPPSMTHSEKTKNRAVKYYTELFALAAKKVKPNQHLVLSSCSSHIDFQDFFAIIDEAMSLSRKTAQILQVSGQGADHPFPHFCRELQYLKYVHLRLF